MPKLYSYCIPYDNGSAPNPFGGICTLVICKPVIRRTAQVGDWIVATGSAEFGFQNMVVYAMEITKKMTMSDYDKYCKSSLSIKIPGNSANEYEKIAGDCIYDFKVDPPKIRLGSVHNEGNRDRDLGGKCALLSTDFYYFGGKPLLLPDHLLNIVRQGQGHKSTSNDSYFESFVHWIDTFKNRKNTVFAKPYLMEQLVFKDGNNKCASCRKDAHDEDELIGDE